MQASVAANAFMHTAGWLCRYPGGLKERVAKFQYEQEPESILWKAVNGMIPKNRLRQVDPKLALPCIPLKLTTSFAKLRHSVACCVAEIITSDACRPACASCASSQMQNTRSKMISGCCHGRCQHAGSGSKRQLLRFLRVLSHSTRRPIGADLGTCSLQRLCCKPWRLAGTFLYHKAQHRSEHARFTLILS